MGILVQNQITKNFIFYLKGADNVMIPKFPENEKIFISEQTESLSIEGKQTFFNYINVNVNL